MNPDYANAIFEFVGSLFLWLNVSKLIEDKKVRGVSVVPFVFYSCWGLWNLWYYPAVNCPYSWLAGIFVVFANVTWVALALRYTWGERALAAKKGYFCCSICGEAYESENEPEGCPKCGGIICAGDE